MELYFSKLNLPLQFEKPIIYNIKEINLKPNSSIDYLNMSYINYYDQITHNNEIIKFHTFFKDEFLLILIDIYDIILKTTVYHKNILLIKLDWELKKFYDDLYLWEIKNDKNLTFKYFNLPIRRDLEDNDDIFLHDILLVNKCIHYKVILNSTKIFTKKNILSLFS